MNYLKTLLVSLVLAPVLAWAQPVRTTPTIKVDSFSNSTSAGRYFTDAPTDTVHWVGDYDDWNMAAFPETVTFGFNIATADGYLAPDGTYTADLVTETTAASTQHWVRKDNIPAVNGEYYTVSAYVKAAGRSEVSQFGSGSFAGSARFNLNNGTMNTVSQYGSSIVPAGNGWYRIATTLLVTGATSSTVVYPMQMYDNVGAATYTGDGVSGVYVWGMQVVRGRSPAPYRRPLSNNLLADPNKLDATTWGKENVGSTTPVVTADAAYSPSGLKDAERVDFGATDAVGDESTLYQGVTTANTLTVKASIWARTVSGTGTLYLNLIGTANNSTPCQLTTVWKLCTVSGLGASGTSFLSIGPDARVGRNQPTNQPALSVYLWNGSLVRPDIDETFTMVGTVPIQTQSGLYPKGYGFEKPWVGPFSATNYFQAPNNTLGEWTGDWSVTVVFRPTSFGTTQILTGKSNGTSTAGWSCYLASNGLVGAFVYDGALKQPGGTGTAILNAVNVLTCGRSGGTVYARVNAGTPGTVGSVGTMTSAATQPLYVGNSLAGSPATTTTIYEIYGSTAAYNEATVTELHSAALSGRSLANAAAADSKTTFFWTVDGFEGVPLLGWPGVGGTLTHNGVVPVGNTYYPTAVAGFANRPGYGTWSDANYIQLTTGLDVEDTSGDRYGCAAFRPSTLTAAAERGIVGNGTFNVRGHNTFLSTAGVFTHQSNSSGSNGSPSTANAITPLGMNVACWWRTGTTVAAKLNLGTTATAVAAAAEVSGEAATTVIGRGATAGFPFDGTIYEVVTGKGTCPDTSCEVWATKQMARVFGIADSRNNVATNSRGATTPATSQSDFAEVPQASGQLALPVPNSIPTVTPSGVSVWKTTSNYVLNNNASCIAGAVGTSWAVAGNLTCVANNSVSPDGSVTADDWSNTLGTNTDNFRQTTTTASSTTFTGSAWMKKSASGVASILVGMGSNVSGCACGTSDGSSCTATVAAGAATYCHGRFTVGTTSMRGWVSGTATTATTAPILALYPGEYNVSVGATTFWGTQLETGLFPTSVISTGATSVARAADVVSIANPLTFAKDNRAWCVGATPTFDARSDGVYRTIIDSGPGLANSFTLSHTSTNNLEFSVWDAASAVKYVTAPKPTSGPHKVVACSNQGDLKIYVDGNLATSGAATGAGTGRITTQAASLYVGTVDAGTSPYNGYIANVSAWDTARPEQYGLDATWATQNTEVVNLPMTSSGAGFDCTGALSCVSFDGRQNLVPYSEDLGNAAWLNYASTDAAVPDQGDGYTWRSVTGSGAAGSLYQTPTIFISATRTSAVTVRAPSGTVSAGVMMSCQSGTVSGCTCSRSDGGACTPVVTSAYQCTAQATNLGTTPVRLYATGTCGSALITSAIALIPGNISGATGTAWFTQPQLTIGAATAYVPTTATARTSVPVESATGVGSWATNGSPLNVASTALPTTASSGAAGPFSDANYYSNGTGADALDSTGDRWGCVSFVPDSFGANTTFMVQNESSTVVAGHSVYLAATTGTFGFESIRTGPAASSANTANAAVLSGYNVGCWWRSGTTAGSTATLSAKLNLGTTASLSGLPQEIAGTAYVLRIGRGEAALRSFPGKILHVVQGLGSCPTPPAPFAATCEGWATYQMKRQFGLIGSRGEEIAFTRATTATNEVNGTVWNVPSGVPRVSTQGLLVERLSTNAILQSQDITVAGGWTAANATATADQGTGPTAGFELINTTVAGGGVFRTATVTTTTGPYTASAMVASGTDAYVAAFCSAGVSTTSCTCTRSDGGSCTATQTPANCFARTTVGATPVTLAATLSCGTTTATWGVSVGGSYASTGTALFGNAQLEAGSTATSRIPTTVAAVARNADVAQLNSTPLGSMTGFCLEGVFTPSNRNWTTTPAKTLLSTYNGSFLQTISLYEGYLGGGITASLLGNPATGQSAIVTGALSAGAHRISVSGTLAGIPMVRVDGATPAFTTSGSPGTLSAWSNTRLYLGAATPGTTEFDGYLKDLKVYWRHTCK